MKLLLVAALLFQLAFIAADENVFSTALAKVLRDVNVHSKNPHFLLPMEITAISRMDIKFAETQCLKNETNKDLCETFPNSATYLYTVELGFDKDGKEKVTVVNSKKI
ncbi:hypothetical protein L596_028562 [Steinernema carpocapsae]|uniref:Cystatin domain-containing protein n=1 Tax=Steinernema carpocapsae TaxID=34508 RepID=A0A4U5LYV4_STECR|nr:hypothetical protein L596_028562 [Steinernema carpocapsae]